MILYVSDSSFLPSMLTGQKSLAFEPLNSTSISFTIGIRQLRHACPFHCVWFLLMSQLTTAMRPSDIRREYVAPVTEKEPTYDGVTVAVVFVLPAQAAEAGYAVQLALLFEVACTCCGTIYVYELSLSRLSTILTFTFSAAGAQREEARRSVNRRSERFMPTDFITHRT